MDRHFLPTKKKTRKKEIDERDAQVADSPPRRGIRVTPMRDTPRPKTIKDLSPDPERNHFPGGVGSRVVSRRVG